MCSDSLPHENIMTNNDFDSPNHSLCATDFLEEPKPYDQIQALTAEIRHTNKILEDKYQLLIQTQQQLIETQRIFVELYLRDNKLSWIKRLLKPRLGELVQYPPRPLLITNQDMKLYSPEKLPSLSIVTPSFNQGIFIKRTLDSVLFQDYPHLEYVVQDGGSTDETINILEQYDSSLTHWESKKDNGQTQAINLGFAKTQGEIMAYLNSDDLLLPNALHYIGNYFAEHEEVDVVYGHRILINQEDQEIGRWVLPRHSSNVLSWADYIPQETLFWRRRIWEKVGGKLDESFHFAMDWDLLLRFREAGAKFARLPRFLGAFRIHHQQKTSAEINQAGQLEMNRLRMRCHGREVSRREIKYHLLPYLLSHIFYNKLHRLGFML